MAECFRCGISSEKTNLFDIIYGKGLVKVCANCSREDGSPMIQKPTNFQLKTAETPSTVYERLSRMRGLDPVKHREHFSSGAAGRRDGVVKQEATLRKIVDDTYNKKMESAKLSGKPSRMDLVENFHWVILRARRLRKITHEQLAKEIGEPESVLKMIEGGILPDNEVPVINKLESFFKIKLIKVEKPAEPKRLSFDSFSAKNLTIADLKKIQEGPTNELALGDAAEIALSEGNEKEGEKKGFFSKFFGGKKEEPKSEEQKNEGQVKESNNQEEKKTSPNNIEEFYE